MKFSDGNWQIPDHLSLMHPVRVFDYEEKDGELIVYASTWDARERAAQINARLLTYHFFSPCEGIIGVRIEHFQGGLKKGPKFDLYCDPKTTTDISIQNETASFTSGNLTARINRGSQWRLDFLRGDEVITSSQYKSSGHATDHQHDDEAHIFERLDLGVGDLVYGLGERFTSFVKNGQSVEIWNRDGGANTEQAYKNIPFFQTNRGWGLFVNDPGRVEFEIGSEKASKAQFSVPGESLEYYLIDGPDPKGVIDRFTKLTGRPALPKSWSFGLWLTTSFTTSYDEQTVNRFLDGMAERDIPLHVFHFDCFWMKGLHWCDFEWDPVTFPEPEAMLQRYKARGLKICVWINPYIGQRSRLFAEGMERGYLLKRQDGSVWQWDKWQPGMGIVDFTNPDACRWYADKLKALLRMGVDCFKTDFGERIPTDVAYHDGSDSEKMHNYYALLYNKVVYEAIEEELGKGEAVLFARSASIGSQQFPVHWGGDCFSDFVAMAETLRSGLSLGMCGFGFWSHDIGGFEDTSSPDVYKRWCAFGLLSSHSRLHGSKSYRVPWAYDYEACDVLRTFAGLKCQLMPTIYSASCEATRTGLPVMRAMLLEFPQDPSCQTLDLQYMLGSSLLVAPVFSQSGDVAVYLPEGSWTHLLTGEVVEGGKWRQECHDVFSLPLYVRPNSLLIWGADDQRPDYNYAEGSVFALYQLEDGASASASLHVDGGAHFQTLTVFRLGRRLSVEPSDVTRPWTLRLEAIKDVAGLAGSIELVKSGSYVTLSGTGKGAIDLR